MEYTKYINLSRLDPRNGESLRNFLLNAREYDLESSILLDKFIDLICKCLLYDPRSRITAYEALNHSFLVSHTQKLHEKYTEVPWPILPYTKGFLACKNNTKPKAYTKLPKNDSISQDASPTSKHSTAVSRNSPRVSSSDEEAIQKERPASYVPSEAQLKHIKSNVTPKY